MAEININLITHSSATVFGKDRFPSLQRGDYAYYQNIDNNELLPTANDPIFIGKITKVGDNYIKVESNLDPANIVGFLMFSKSKLINNSSLNGYYAEVTFRNNDSHNKSEIFAINSEVSQSSK